MANGGSTIKEGTSLGQPLRQADFGSPGQAGQDAGVVSPQQEEERGRQLRQEQRLTQLREQAKAKKAAAVGGASALAAGGAQGGLGGAAQAGVQQAQKAGKEGGKKLLNLADAAIFKSFTLIMLVVHLPLWFFKRLKIPLLSDAIPELGEQWLPPGMSFDTPGAPQLPKIYGYAQKLGIVLILMLFGSLIVLSFVQYYILYNPCVLLEGITDPGLLVKAAKTTCNAGKAIVAFNIELFMEVLTVFQ